MSSYRAPTITHAQLFTNEEIVMCLFFLLTTPIWFLAIFSVRMAKIVTGILEEHFYFILFLVYCYISIYFLAGEDLSFCHDAVCILDGATI